jgi:hypothetical protein
MITHYVGGPPPLPTPLPTPADAVALVQRMSPAVAAEYLLLIAARTGGWSWQLREAYLEVAAQATDGTSQHGC